MHFFSTITVALVALSTGAYAAECHAQSGGRRCLSRSDANTAVDQFCGAHWGGRCTDWQQFRGSDGSVGYIGQVGRFLSREQCVDAGRSIINECHGKKDGGSWTFNSASINIKYCDW